MRFWPAAPPVDLSEAELMRLLREEHHLRSWHLRAYACYLVDQSRKKGWTYFFQPTAAKRFKVSVCTIHRWTHTLLELGLFAARKTHRELQLTPNWEVLLFLRKPESSPAVTEEVQEHMREHLQERSLENCELVEAQPEKSSSAPDPRTHTYEMQAAATSEFHPPALPRETGLSDAHGCDAHPVSPVEPAASSVQLPPRAPLARSLPAREGPQKPEKHRGESLPDPDLHRRLERLPDGRDAAGPIVRGIPPEEHRLIVRELEVVRPDHAGRYVHSLIRDWTRRRVVALEREQAELRARAAAQKRQQAEQEAEAERARACAQAARERAAGDDTRTNWVELFKAGKAGSTRPIPAKSTDSS